MLIRKPGKIIHFDCGPCGCQFVIGILCASTPDNGENYYCNCPVCGNECHASVNDIQEIGKGDKA